MSLLSCLLLAACSSGPATHAAPAAQAGGRSADAATDVASCAARGGALRPLGRRGLLRCVVPFADAGKACSDSDQCQGDCLVATPVESGAPAQGTCQRDISENFGCRQEVRGGMGASQICID